MRETPIRPARRSLRSPRALWRVVFQGVPTGHCMTCRKPLPEGETDCAECRSNWAW